MILTERKKRPSSNGVGFGRLVHPTSTAGSGNPRRVEQSTINVNEVFYRCRNCGFHCLESRVQSPGGTAEGNGGVVVSSSDPIVQSGYCPFCASANSRAA